MCTSVRSGGGWMYCQHLSSTVVPWSAVWWSVWSDRITGIIRGDISISEYHQITADYSRPSQDTKTFPVDIWKFLINTEGLSSTELKILTFSPTRQDVAKVDDSVGRVIFCNACRFSFPERNFPPETPRLLLSAVLHLVSVLRSTSNP